MQIKAIGHIVLKVRNLDRSAAFYRDVLGMQEVMRYQGAMAFFSFGDNHHDHQPDPNRHDDHVRAAFSSR